MAVFVHLVRSAQVDNPGDLVCGALPGFDLSPLGLEQARRAGRYLGPRPVVAIWSSPAQRSLRTAEEIAARSGVPVKVHPDLAPWTVTVRWQGHPWNSLHELFPGEVEAYRQHPQTLEFVDEQLSDVAERAALVARELDETHPHGDVVMVSHRDVLAAARLQLTGSGIAGLHETATPNGSVVTLRPGSSWVVETSWEPSDSPRFGESSGLRVVSGAAPITDGPSSA